jgi:hypothetical protein
MLFNPLFVQTSSQTDLIATPKASKLNNASYLFSDIIRIVDENNSQSNQSSEPALNKKAGSEDSLLNSLSIILSSLNQIDANSATKAETSNGIINIDDLIKGLLPENSKNNKSILETSESTSKSSDTKTINLLTNSSDVNSFLQIIFNLFPALKITPVDDRNFLVQPAANRSNGSVTDEKQKIEKIISNFLQTNNNVILNFNIGSKQFNVEIQKIEDPFKSLKSDVQTGSTSELINTTGKTQDNKNFSSEVSSNNFFVDLTENSNTKVVIKNSNSNDLNLSLVDSKTTSKNNESNYPNAAINQNVEEEKNFNSTTLNNVEVESNLTKSNYTSENNQITSIIGNNTEHIKVSSTSKEVEKQNYVDIKFQPLQSTQEKDYEGLTGNNFANKTGLTSSQTRNVLTSNNSQNSKAEDNLGQTSEETVKTTVENKSETNLTKPFQIPYGDDKFVITIKVTPETKGDVENKPSTQIKTESSSSLQSSTSTDNFQIKSEDKNSVETGNNNFIQIKQPNLQAPVRELFEPPLVLKLSLKHQLKSIEQVDTKTADTSVDGSSTREKENILNSPNFSSEHNTQKQIQTENQTFNESAKEVAKSTANNSTEKENEIYTPVFKEQVSDSKDLSTNETRNIFEINEGSQISNSAGVNRIAAIENNSGDYKNDFSKNKTKDEISNFVTNQVTDKNVNQIFQTDKIPDNINQLNNSIKTIEIANLSKEISKFVLQGESKNLVLQLKPENLGKVKISLDVSGNSVSAHVEVENDSVKQMVQTHIDNLKQSLNLNGLQLSTLDVELSGGEQKPSRFFNAKKKSQYSAASNKIEEIPDSVAAKKLGYNTYEYLI